MPLDLPRLLDAPPRAMPLAPTRLLDAPPRLLDAPPRLLLPPRAMTFNPPRLDAPPRAMPLAPTRLDAPPRMVTVSGVVVGERGSVAAAIARLGARARFALGKIGEGREPQLVAPMADEDARMLSLCFPAVVVSEDRHLAGSLCSPAVVDRHLAGRRAVLPMHSGLSSIAVAMGAGFSSSSRRFYSKSLAAKAQPQHDLVSRVDALEVKTDALKCDTLVLGEKAKALDNKTSILDTRIKSLRRSISRIVCVGGGYGALCIGGSTTIYVMWDSVKVREFFMDQGSKAAKEYKDGVWNSTKKYLAEKCTVSNALDVMSRYSRGWIGSTIEQQAIKEKQRKQAMLVEQQRWQRFLRGRPKGEQYHFSVAIYMLKEVGRKGELARLSKFEMSKRRDDSEKVEEEKKKKRED